ncbi:hypothetical protein [Gordonia rubripertincta]|uniref:hypothetical protein n=1 Tax=Gordonia rubripertincta TaxID=36822 RepID=UPI00163DE49E|nr:hypothetical protein [Gordonia rubripertincta]
MTAIVILRAAIAEGWQMWHELPNGADRGRLCAHVQTLEQHAARLDQVQPD